jgi:hypothetical protein
MNRYARQIQLDALGPVGQQALEAASVLVRGDGLAARVCALYLLGAGVGTVEVSADTASVCQDMNSGVQLVVRPDGLPHNAESKLSVTVRKVSGPVYLNPIADGDPVAQGSGAARWAMQEILR